MEFEEGWLESSGQTCSMLGMIGIEGTVCGGKGGKVTDWDRKGNEGVKWDSSNTTCLDMYTLLSKAKHM